MDLLAFPARKADRRADRRLTRSPAERRSARVRRQLINTLLFEQPTSLTIGLICAVVATKVGSALAGDPALKGIAAAIAVLAILRIFISIRLKRSAARLSLAVLEWLYQSVSLMVAGGLGLFAACALVADVPPDVQLLGASTAIFYGLGGAARNAAWPVNANAILALTTIPILLAALWVGGLAMLALAGVIAMIIPGMTTVIRSMERVLRESLEASERNAELAHEMQRLARTDAVTGLGNRAGLNHALAETLATRSKDERLALMWIDLDRFKEVNDLLGHPVGDKVLKLVARRLSEISPQGSTIARFGGDEFVVLTPVEDRREAERIASEVHAGIMMPMRMEEGRIEVRASIGVALMPEDASDADALLQSADQALYHAKVGGRAQTRFFEPGMTRALARRREIEAELRTALVRDELSIYFQPVVDLETGKIRSFEALARWFHAEKGELSPAEFIPVAEETGAIVTLGNWITRQAARTAAGWPEHVTLSVNLSPLQIRAPGAALGIRNALREAGLAPHRLELEVTESLFIEDSEATAAFIEDLSALGVTFALDDFGTGYSSLGHFQQYPFHKIKVDRSFVSGPHVGHKSDAIIRAVAEMAARLDMQIVAEGLETIEQVQAVRAAGCTLGQGYYFSRAVPDHVAAVMLAQEGRTDAEGALPRAAGEG